MSLSPEREDNVRTLRVRMQVMVTLAVVAVLILVGRLFQLQILEGDHFRRRAVQNFTQTIDVAAPRGRIFDVKGRPLATNRAAYALWVTAWPRVEVPVEGRDGEFVIKRQPVSDDQISELASLINFVDDRDRDDFVGRIEELRESKSKGRYSKAVRNNISWEENARIQTRERLSEWVEIRKSARRFFPQGELTAFVTGYMQEIDKKRLQSATHGEYRLGDRVGRTGLELNWENYLRGRLGSRSRVVNARNLEARDPPQHALDALPPDRDPIPGQDIFLSLDVDLQRVTWDEFKGKPAGGAVVMEVDTGRILAMVSKPGIDPNEWEEPFTYAQYQEWLNDPLRPFRDKTVQDIFFPGSTYKVVSALTALREPGFDPYRELDCGLFVEYGGRRFHDTHACGLTNLEGAIVQSCNVYFYNLAMDGTLNLAKMEKVARELGLGERTGLGLNTEARGVVPTEAIEAQEGRFQRGVTLNNAIGQGNVKATVLQIAVLYAALANGGYVMTPTLVDRIETRDGQLVYQAQAQAKNREPVFPSRHREIVHRGLVGVVQDEHGTAYTQRLDTVAVAGKTGTAQTGKVRRRDDETEIEGWDRSQEHAWFAAYGPADDPKIVVVSMVEHGGAGADAAAPIVMSVIDYYIQDHGLSVGVKPRKAGVPPPLPGRRNRPQEGP